MKKILSIVLCLIMVLSLAACGGEKAPVEENNEGGETKTSGFKIGYSIGYVGNAWRSQLVSALEEVAEEYKADGTIAEFQVVSADNDSTTQISQCNAMLAEGLDSLLICAVSPTTLTSVVETAKEMGTLVILSNDPAVYEGTYCCINNANTYTALIDRWFATQVEGGSDIVYISGNPGNGTDGIRDSQVYSDIEKYGWNLLAEAPGKRNQAEAQNVMTTFLSAYKNIDGVLCQNTTFEGVKHAYDNANIPMPVVAGDSVMSTIRMLAEMDNYQSIGATNSPGVGADSLHFAVLLLQGYELKAEALTPNPLDETLADYPLLTVLSYAEAIEMYADMEDTYIPDAVMSRQDCIDTWFVAK